VAPHFQGYIQYRKRIKVYFEQTNANYIFLRRERMKRFLIVGTLLLAVMVNSSFAVGALFARRALSNDAMQPLWLTNYIAECTITDQIAVTHIDQTFKNETSQRLEGIFVFPLPPTAIITELALWENGRRNVASIKPNDTARMIYDNTVRRTIDPALLEYMGNNLFKLSVFPIDPAGSALAERRIEVTYAELLPYALNQVEYRFFMKTANLSSKPLQRVSISYSITSQKKILSLTSPTHEADAGYYFTKNSDYNYTGIFGNENSYSDKDFRLVYQFESNAFALNHLTYVPRTDSAMFYDSPGDNPYFVLWVTTPDTIRIMKKNVVFIADISSSMAGTRISQLKNSLKSMVGMLNSSDKFNIVVFSTSYRRFMPNLVVADSANRAAAGVFVNQLTEMGLTDMEDAFKAGLSSAWDDSSVNAAVFLTDGLPTWPVSSTSQNVRDTVRKYNQGGVAVYSFGIGEGVDESFLTVLSKENGGNYTHIATDDSITYTMTNFMRMISYPLIKNCAINYGGLQTFDVLPNPLPNLVATTQLTVLGRYSGTGNYNVTFSGMAGVNPLTLSRNLPFPASTQSHKFVPRMWASAKINALLEQIAMYGELRELVDGVRSLGMKYAIITPYTSLVTTPVKPGQPVEDKTAPMAAAFKLFQNAPNPITSVTTLKYAIPVKSVPQQVSIKIYDARGRLVRTLLNDMTMGGNFSVKWDAKDNFGKRVAAGFYFAVLEASTARNMIQMRVL
jgi:Ca-activated chloride channel homolog